MNKDRVLKGEKSPSRVPIYYLNKHLNDSTTLSALGATTTGSVIFVQLPATNLGNPSGNQGWWARLTQPLRSSAEKFAGYFRGGDLPRTEPAFKADAISLSRPAKPSPQLYEALARLAEQRGRFDEAEQYYQQALHIAPTHLESLLGYARLKDRLGEVEAAAALYRRALAAHPREPAVYNDFALFQARRGNLGQAARLMEEAIRLQPRRWLYRTNMAVIMLELGQPQQALEHLQVVQDPASACYNLGYLAYRKGDVGLAYVYFQQALDHNPKLEAARQWLEALTGTHGASPGASISLGPLGPGGSDHLSGLPPPGPFIPPDFGTGSTSLPGPVWAEDVPGGLNGPAILSVPPAMGSPATITR